MIGGAAGRPRMSEPQPQNAVKKNGGSIDLLPPCTETRP